MRFFSAVAIGTGLWLSLAAAEPNGFSPTSLKTEFRAVKVANRLSYSAQDDFVRRANRDLGVEMRVAVRLKKGMRRAVAFDEDLDTSNQPLEYTLSAGTTLSERRFTSSNYLNHGRHIYVGYSETWEGSTLYSFQRGRRGFKLIDSLKLEYEEHPKNAPAGLILLDLTGDGRLEAIVPLVTSSSAESGALTITSIDQDGALQSLVHQPLRTKDAACSPVDLDRDGIWEIEVQESFDRSAEHPYCYNRLYRWSRLKREFIDVTAQLPWLYGRERRFYRALLPQLGESAIYDAPPSRSQVSRYLREVWHE